MVDILTPATESFLSQLSPESIGQLQAAFTAIAGNAISGVELMDGGFEEIIEWLRPKKAIDRGLLRIIGLLLVFGTPILIGTYIGKRSNLYPPTENE